MNKRNKIHIYDTHTHTFVSHDGTPSCLEMIEYAINNNIDGFAITDHIDIEYVGKLNIFNLVKESLNEANLKNNSNVLVLKGIEIGEASWFPNISNEIIHNYDFDLVLSSVHAVRFKDLTIPFSRIDFSKLDIKVIYEYLDKYFDEIIEMINTIDFDVLAHLTVPLRYIIGKYNININLDKYKDKITYILKLIISKNIALEINSSCLGSNYNELLPSIDIIKEYYELGGILITYGSDAHIKENIGKHFNKVIDELLNIGFNELYYYEKRIPKPYKIER